MATNASADSLLGQLQRGRGLGFLRALQEDTTHVSPLLLACILDDPRWDRQLESRSLYYVPLLIKCGTPLEPIVEHLRTKEDQNQDGYIELATETLINLAYREYLNAGDLLNDYLSYGCHWDMALEALLDIDYDPDGLDDYDHVLSRRFPDDDAPLRRWLRQKQSDESPWKEWKALNPRIMRIFAEIEDGEKRARRVDRDARKRYGQLPLPQLLGMLEDDTSRWVLDVLRERATTADIATWLVAVMNTTPIWSGTALRILQRAKPASPDLLAPLCDLLESGAHYPDTVYTNAASALAFLPAEVTLDLARAWYDSVNQWQRWAADRIMDNHAHASDIPLLYAALLPAMERAGQPFGGFYRVSSILDVLARYPDQGPYPEVEAIFREAGYSWQRWRAAKVLFVSEPDRFGREPAYECLWDCEDNVREVGCSAVHLDISGARERLHVIQHDASIEEGVRRRAKARLTANL